MASHQHDETFTYCPTCGHRLGRRRLRATEPERPVCGHCGFVVYLDPKVAVGTIITNDEGHVALVRRSIEPGFGCWVFPGGYVDRGETLTDAAVREALEESNLQIAIDRLLNVYSYTGQTPVVIVFAATVIGGQLRAEDESSEAAWFDRPSLPWSDLAFPSTRDALRDYFGLA